MKYIIDTNGFLFGVGGPKTITPEGMKDTEIEPSSNLIKPKFENGLWVEGANQTEIETYNRQFIPETPLWRIRVIIKVMGIESTIETALESLQEPTKTAAQYVWNYGTVIERNSQTVQFIQLVVGLTDKEVDELFNQANAIQV